ncbi:MAG: N-acetyltransferase [Alphaproteobacteria bacterium]|nr:N-acetyltransferase [Alphaproteobacteria bacterium]MCW5740032.1 N-acetyltransferase [Alphaproteobacteria bacterium]
MIDEETPADVDAIAALNRAAFGGEEEVEIIDRLRRDGLLVLSLVERDARGIVGHILFSALDVAVDGRAVRSVALAPMAVAPARQRGGVGSRLVRHGLNVLRDRGWEAVIVLGHPDYYPRFGFSAALAARLAAPFSGEAFMALELRSDALAGAAGTVRYPRAFRIDTPA